MTCGGTSRYATTGNRLLSARPPVAFSVAEFLDVCFHPCSAAHLPGRQRPGTNGGGLGNGDGIPRTARTSLRACARDAHWRDTAAPCPPAHRPIRIRVGPRRRSAAPG